MYLIAALWNPWTQYEKTRHNAGRIVLDMILNKLNIDPQWTYDKKFHGYVWKTKLNLSQFGKKLPNQIIETVFLKPETYMNLSGDSIQPLMNFYKIPAQQFLVLCDDLDQPFAEYKYKAKWASGGQNGIKHIIEKLGTQDFFRIKIGIGRPKNKQFAVRDWVLSQFSNEELQILDHLTPQLIHHLGLFFQGKI